MVDISLYLTMICDSISKQNKQNTKLAIVLTLFDADNGAQLRCPHADFELKDGLVNSIGQKRYKRPRWMQWQAL